MNLFDVYPVQNINIIRAQGQYLWDDEGTRYLDMYGGHAVISIGHTHPHWVKQIEGQLEQIAFYSNSIRIPLQLQLADLLGEISRKNTYQLFLCNSGAEANENAMKVASFHTGRKKIIAFTGSFHGRTSLAVSATDNPSIVSPVNEMDNILRVPFNDGIALRECFAKCRNEIAAVIVEPIQGVGGIQLASTEFLQTIRELCDENDSVFISDEVQCGYGRTGKFYAADYAEVNADIYTMAKGMGNGFPIGAISIAPHIASRHFMLGTTFGGNHLACAAAIAVLEVIKKERLMENAQKMGDYLMSRLQQIEDIKNVRGQGLMIGFDVPDRFSDLRQNLLYKHKIFTGTAKNGVIRLLPSLALDKEGADVFLTALREEISFLKNRNIEKFSFSK